MTALVAAFVAGTGYLALSDYRSAPDDLGRWSALTGAATGAAGVVRPLDGSATGVRPPGDPFGEAAVALRGAPSRVRITAIGLDTGLERLHLASDGALTPPNGFTAAGWYAEGTAPGDIGPAVIAGHVDSKAGPAVFYRLRELTAGDRIEVVRGGTVVRFTVTRTAWYPKAKFPSTQVYGPTPDRQLRLITCGGVFDHRLRSYKDNLVVYAVAG
jgi:sortase family protein